MEKAWISATFLTGRYHGEEWPPSPARLVQALVAAGKTGANRSRWPETEAVVRWLEGQDPPRILARATTRPAKYRLAVPNNDLDAVARKGPLTQKATSGINTLKQVAPWEVQAVPGPHVVYEWTPKKSGGAEWSTELLQKAARQVYALGWGIDMAYADAGMAEPRNSDGYEEWLPSASGTDLRVPIPGFLDDLERTYALYQMRNRGEGVDTDTRAITYGLQAYRRQGESKVPAAAFSLVATDSERAVNFPWVATMRVAGWLRHAAGIALEGEDILEDMKAYVYGHGEDEASKNRRIAYLPLPSVGHVNADGRIRRVLIAEPGDAPGIAAKLLRVKLRGWFLEDSERGAVAALQGFEEPSHWFTRRARRWRTVTPVILHGHNVERKGVISIAKTERLLRRAFAMAGFSTDGAGLRFQNAPYWAGTGAATSLPVPEHLQRYPRLHVEVEFREEVTGPVTAGLGRFLGIGLFAAG